MVVALHIVLFLQLAKSPLPIRDDNRSHFPSPSAPIASGCRFFPCPPLFFFFSHGARHFSCTAKNLPVFPSTSKRSMIFSCDCLDKNFSVLFLFSPAALSRQEVCDFPFLLARFRSFFSPFAACCIFFVPNVSFFFLKSFVKLVSKPPRWGDFLRISFRSNRAPLAVFFWLPVSTLKSRFAPTEIEVPFSF